MSETGGKADRPLLVTPGHIVVWRAILPASGKYQEVGESGP